MGWEKMDMRLRYINLMLMRKLRKIKIKGKNGIEIC
jgi:hypothetical protein